MRTRSVRLSVRSFAVVGLLLLAPSAGFADLSVPLISSLPDWVSLTANKDRSPDYRGPVDGTPAMFGDTFVGLLDINTDNDGIRSAARIPFSGGSNRLVIARSNSDLVRDRFYVAYEHTTGSLSASSQAVTSSGASLDRTFLGLEKTFLDGQASVEVRLPFAAQRDFTFDRFSIQSDGVLGNVGLIGEVAVVFFTSRMAFCEVLPALLSCTLRQRWEDGDSATLMSGPRTQTLSNMSGQQSVLNLASGLHLELPGNANARVGVNVPLKNDQRFHDATLMVQVNIGL
jgi:hypothetical protein